MLSYQWALSPVCAALIPQSRVRRDPERVTAGCRPLKVSRNPEVYLNVEREVFVSRHSPRERPRIGVGTEKNRVGMAGEIQ